MVAVLPVSENTIHASTRAKMKLGTASPMKPMKVMQ